MDTGVTQLLIEIYNFIINNLAEDNCVIRKVEHDIIIYQRGRTIYVPSTIRGFLAFPSNFKLCILSAPDLQELVNNLTDLVIKTGKVDLRVQNGIAYPVDYGIDFKCMKKFAFPNSNEYTMVTFFKLRLDTLRQGSLGLALAWLLSEETRKLLSSTKP